VAVVVALAAGAHTGVWPSNSCCRVRRFLFVRPQDEHDNEQAALVNTFERKQTDAAFVFGRRSPD
jgi:hypothetical protein